MTSHRIFEGVLQDLRVFYEASAESLEAVVFTAKFEG